MNLIELDTYFALDNESSLSDNDLKVNIVTKKPKSIFLKLIDYAFSAFIITPISIFFWTSTWDLFEDNVNPKYFAFKILLTFLICNTILLSAYIFQYKLQSFHDKLRAKMNPNSGSYGKDFLFRCIYTYLLTIAYNLQWITYWDLYNKVAEDLHYGYFLGLAFISVIVYKFAVRKSLINLSRTVPYHLQKDEDLDSFFLQSKNIVLEETSYKNWLEDVLNFFYNEMIEIIIFVYIWKGFWDFFNVGVNDLFGNNYKSQVISFIISASTGYGLFFVLIIAQKFAKHNILKEFFHFWAFVSVIALWHLFGDGYDYYLPETLVSKLAIKIITHFVCFGLICVLRLKLVLFGPLSIPAYCKEHEDPSQDMFEISYFSK